jgi:hypothetical protein
MGLVVALLGLAVGAAALAADPPAIGLPVAGALLVVTPVAGVSVRRREPVPILRRPRPGNDDPYSIASPTGGGARVMLAAGGALPTAGRIRADDSGRGQLARAIPPETTPAELSDGEQSGARPLRQRPGVGRRHRAADRRADDLARRPRRPGIAAELSSGATSTARCAAPVGLARFAAAWLAQLLPAAPAPVRFTPTPLPVVAALARSRWGDSPPGPARATPNSPGRGRPTRTWPRRSGPTGRPTARPPRRWPSVCSVSRRCAARRRQSRLGCRALIPRARRGHVRSPVSSRGLRMPEAGRSGAGYGATGVHYAGGRSGCGA